ncbi:MAG: sulfurtransferase-like selenium metabolism protein YedF [Pseudoflavonifractor sp.]|nr:sulfurtransferase-like selenium metabolism protein YedF [Pseudoflavonifractor sp.]
MKEIDARGLACPQPVILTRKAMLAGEKLLTVRVDNAAAVENLKRLADSQGYQAAVTGAEGDYALTLSGEGAAVPAAAEEGPGTGDWAVFIGRDIIGAGDRTLGGNLMRMYLYTLAQGEEAPAFLLFMNAGVKIPTLDDQAAEHLKALETRGTRVLVCGTCLNFYSLTEQLKVGTVSNMYDIVSAMGQSAKVISL